jgi:membrane protease YdiL (CAAX protease family)
VIAPGAISWLSGFVLLPHAFWQFGEPLLLLSGFTTLFCVGMILGWARLATRSLWLPFGLHAGWIFSLRSFAKFSRHPAPPSIWFGETLLVGLGSVAAVLLTGLLVWLALRREKNAEDFPAATAASSLP